MNTITEPITKTHITYLEFTGNRIRLIILCGWSYHIHQSEDISLQFVRSMVLQHGPIRYHGNLHIVLRDGGGQIS